MLLKKKHFYDWPQIGRAPNGAEMTNNKRGRPRRRVYLSVCVNFAHSRQQADEEILWPSDVTGQRCMENQSIYLTNLRYILLVWQVAKFHQAKHEIQIQ